MWIIHLWTGDHQRVLEAHGYKVAIISQPDWKDENSIAIYGRPKLAFWCAPEIWIQW